MRKLIITLSIATSLASGGCSSNDQDSACLELASCCASLPPSEAQLCTRNVSASSITLDACASALSTYESAGECGGKDAGSASDAGAPSHEGGAQPSLEAGRGGSVDAGAQATGCEGLATCCPTLPVAQDPTECMEVAATGTEEACEASLMTYQGAGFCGGGAACFMRHQPASCGECLSKSCGAVLGTFEAACADFLSCSCLASQADSGGLTCDSTLDESCNEATGTLESCTMKSCASACDVDMGGGFLPPTSIACRHDEECTVQAVTMVQSADDLEGVCTSGGGLPSAACPTSGLSGCCSTSKGAMKSEICYYHVPKSGLKQAEGNCKGAWSLTQ